MKRLRSDKGFTGIEIAVIGAGTMIVGAVLFPVFARARENARRANCQLNLRDVGLGFAQYVMDYDNLYPRPSHNWCSYELEAYERSLKVFSCPTAVETSPNAMFDYGYNSNVAGRDYTRIATLQMTVLSFDSHPKSMGHEAVGTPTSGDRPVRDLHLDGANFGYADGHIKWLPMSVALQSKTITFDLN